MTLWRVHLKRVVRSFLVTFAHPPICLKEAPADLASATMRATKATTILDLRMMGAYWTTTVVFRRTGSLTDFRTPSSWENAMGQISKVMMHSRSGLALLRAEAGLLLRGDRSCGVVIPSMVLTWKGQVASPVNSTRRCSLATIPVELSSAYATAVFTFCLKRSIQAPSLTRPMEPT